MTNIELIDEYLKDWNLPEIEKLDDADEVINDKIKKELRDENNTSKQ